MTDKTKTPLTNRLRNKYKDMECWDRDDIIDGKHDLIASHAKLERTLRESQEALLNYGWHKDCALYLEPDKGKSCDCGFAEVLIALPQPESQE